jgi:hypothetical protein
MSNKESLQEWFERQVRNSSIVDTTVVGFQKPPVEKQNRVWRIHDYNGSIVSSEPGMFKGVFVRTVFKDQKVDERLMLLSGSGEHSTHGVIVLQECVDPATSQRFYHVHTKAETGNMRAPEHTLIAPTIQTSYENAKKHPERVPHMDLLSPNLGDMRGSPYFPVHQDGGMLFDKVNEYRHVLCQTIPEINTERCYLATYEEIIRMAQLGLVNEHLLQALGFFRG